MSDEKLLNEFIKSKNLTGTFLQYKAANEFIGKTYFYSRYDGSIIEITIEKAIFDTYFKDFKLTFNGDKSILLRDIDTKAEVFTKEKNALEASVVKVEKQISFDERSLKKNKSLLVSIKKRIGGK